MEANNDFFIYIRRPGQGWSRGRNYHQTALNHFWEMYNVNNPNPIRVEFPHPDGGNFVGIFRRISDNNSHCEYINEAGQRVELMMCRPEFAAYINRVVDHY